MSGAEQLPVMFAQAATWRIGYDQNKE